MKGLPVVSPLPFSPVHRVQQFSTVLGAIKVKRTKWILPEGKACTTMIF